MHTTMTNTTVIIGRRQMSRGAFVAHCVMIFCSCGLWLPVYWLHKALTKRMRY